MENYVNDNLFVKDFIHLYSRKYLASAIESRQMYSLVFFLPDVAEDVDPMPYIMQMNEVKQAFCKFSGEVVFQSHKKFQEQGLLVTPQLIAYDANLINAGVQTVIECIKLCNKQIFWVSLNNEEFFISA